MPEREETVTDWKRRAEGGYRNLGWVGATGLLDHMVELADLTGDETLVDMGTGSQAVLTTFKKNMTDGTRCFGFDISREMMITGSSNEKQDNLFVANSLRTPLPSGFANIVTARMVYHHIPSHELDTAINEPHRILKPDGKLIISEYVAADSEVWNFERAVFDIKEPERNLWTGEELLDVVGSNWRGEGPVSLSYAVLGQYSVADWMSKSGLPDEKQNEILGMYLNAPEVIRQKMNITITPENDALVDRPFAYIVAVK